MTTSWCPICVGLSAISPQLRLSAPGGCVFCCIVFSVQELSPFLVQHMFKTCGHRDTRWLATLAASWKRNIQKVMVWWWKLKPPYRFANAHRYPYNIYIYSLYHSACSFMLLESTQTKCDSHFTLGSYFVNVLDRPICLVQLQSAELNQRKNQALLTCGHMICHLHMNHEFMINPWNSTERNSTPPKIWIDVDSLNLDYFLLVRVRDNFIFAEQVSEQIVLWCRIASFKSFKSLRLQNPTTLHRPTFRFFNAWRAAFQQKM